jgi:hypothetical protein
MRLFLLILLFSFLSKSYAIELSKERQFKIFKNDALLEVDRRILIHDKFKKCVNKAKVQQDGLKCIDRFVKEATQVDPEIFYTKLLQRR